jgi:hypothetical protein
MNANELKINGNTLEDFLQTSREVDEYDNLDCRICAADCIRQLVDFVSQQQTENEALKAEKSSGVYDLAKTLTDEEIKFIAYPFESLYTTYDKQTDTDTVHTRFDQLGFARAILKKASEK